MKRVHGNSSFFFFTVSVKVRSWFLFLFHKIKNIWFQTVELNKKERKNFSPTYPLGKPMVTRIFS